MALATGTVLGIKGATANGEAFNVLRPFTMTWQNGLGISDVTRRRDKFRRTAPSIKQPGSIFLSCWWDADGGSAGDIAQIPVGRELTTLTLALASGRTIATGTGGTAVIHQMNSVLRKGPSKQIVQMSVRFSGPVTPDFGPEFDVGETGTEILYELRDGEDAGLDFPRSFARRVFHYKHHAPNLSSAGIIEAAEQVSVQADPDSVSGSELSLFAFHPDQPTLLFVHGRRVIEKINPNESKILVTYRDVDFLFGPQPGDIVVGSNFTATQRVYEEKVISNTAIPGIQTAYLSDILVRTQSLIRRTETQKLPNASPALVAAYVDIVASNLGALYEFPTDLSGRPYRLDGAVFRKINNFDDYVVAYTFTSEADMSSLEPAPGSGTWLPVPAAPAFHRIALRFDASGAPIYTIIKPEDHMPIAGSSPVNSEAVPYTP